MTGTGVRVELAGALLRGDSIAVGRLCRALAPPPPPPEARLDAAADWCGPEAAAAIKEASEAIASLDIAAIARRGEPSALARLLGAERAAPRARRLRAATSARIAAFEERIADLALRLEYGTRRLRAAAEAAASHHCHVERLVAEAEAALTLAPEPASLAPAADFATAEKRARLAGLREEVARLAHELRLAAAAAGQAHAFALLLERRDQELSEALRRLVDETLPMWHLQVAAAFALLAAASAGTMLTEVGEAVSRAGEGAGEALREAARQAAAAAEARASDLSCPWLP